MPLNTWDGVTDFAIASRSTPPPLTFDAPTINPANEGGKMEVVMLIDPTDAADPTMGGTMELLESKDAGVTWQPLGQKATWTGGPHMLKDRQLNDMDPPRSGFTFDIGLLSDPNSYINKNLGLRGVLKKSPCRVGLGHKVTPP